MSDLQSQREKLKSGYTPLRLPPPRPVPKPFILPANDAVRSPAEREAKWQADLARMDDEWASFTHADKSFEKEVRQRVADWKKLPAGTFVLHDRGTAHTVVDVPSDAFKSHNECFEEELAKWTETQRDFEADIDDRLSALSIYMGHSPLQCVPVAHFMASEGWTAFVFDMSDIDPARHPGSTEFRNAMLLSAAIYKEDGTRAHATDKEAAYAFVNLARSMNLNSPAESSARTYVAKHRNRERGRSDELLAIYDRDEAALPVDMIVDLRATRLLAELRASAVRLERTAAL